MIFTQSSLIVVNTFYFSTLFRNPMGRTGMRGLGLLGKWGPNHAADPIVTRFVNNHSFLKFVDYTLL